MWETTCCKQGLLVVDVYSQWCGPCSSMTGHLRRVKMELGDDLLILATAQSDTIEALQRFRDKAEPTWLFLGSGKPVTVVHGANGPILLATIREELRREKDVLNGRLERPTVLLESLVKPEEVIEPDEDLDDVETEAQQTGEDTQEVKEELPKQAVLFILPHIIATERAEIFLSHVVSAGFVIAGHLQEELPSREELHNLLQSCLSQEEETEEEKEKEETDEEVEEEEQNGKETEDDTVEDEENQDDASEEKTEEKKKNTEKKEEDLEFWEDQLSQGPLYMLLLRVEEGNIFLMWHHFLGPPNLQVAKEDDPNSLVALFGDEEHVIPAWMPKNKDLQERLISFFPPPPDASIPRLLLLPDTDHQQILEALCSHGVRVLAHTQISLTEELFSSITTTNSSEDLQECIGTALLAAVVTGEETNSAAAELGALHLSSDTKSAINEVASFFPALSAELNASQPDEPQTQMQIEQSKEKG